MKSIHWCIATTVACVFLTASAQAQGPSDEEVALVNTALTGESLAAGETAMAAYLLDHPKSDYVRFGLGLGQFFRSGEVLFGSLYRYGFLSEESLLQYALPFDLSSVPKNPNPEVITYDTLNAMLQAWIDGVDRAEHTLSGITDDDVKLPLPIGLVQLDIDGDGKGEPGEALWSLFNRFQRRFNADEAAAGEFVIAFDRADVSWLRGYCHFMMAIGDFALAHDRQMLFEHCSQVAFAKPKTPFPFLVEEHRQGVDDWMPISDWIAMMHLMRFEVVEPARMIKVHQHLKMVVAMGREMWKYIDAETDNDREWVPSINQSSIIPEAEVTTEIHDAWLAFLDEADLVLDGKRLIRFWRMSRGGDPVEGTGINFKRVFTEPTTFDLVLWIQGTAASPYLEKGTLTTPGLWRRMEQAFNGRVFRWGFWFN